MGDVYIPGALLKLPQWVTYKGLQPDGTMNKQPHQRMNKPETFLSFEKAYKTGYYGFAPQTSDKVLLIDVDHNKDINKLPIELQDWITKNDPYIEISPSGQGLRILARTENKIVKSSITSKYAKAKIKNFEGQITIQGHYQTFTNNWLQGKTIPILPKMLMNYLFNIQYSHSGADVIDFETKEKLIPFNIKTLTKDIMSLPLDQNDNLKRIYKEAYGEEYEHYAYWTMVGMGLHELGSRFASTVLLECQMLFLSWSKTDKIAYVDDADVLTHWKSFAKKDIEISYASVFKLIRMLKFDWPYPLYIKGKNSGFPDVLEYDNFKYLLKHFNITYTFDIISKKGYIEGDKSIIKAMNLSSPVSRDELIPALFRLAINNNFRRFKVSLAKQYTLIWIEEQSKKNSCNKFKEWLLTEPKDKTNENISTFEYLWSCIKIQKTHTRFEELFKTFIYIFFMNLVKSHFYAGPYDDHSGMLLFIGPENTRKTSFFKLLMPEQFKSYVANMSENLESTGSIRDANKIASNNLIIVINEFDSIYNSRNDTKFKIFLTDRTSTFIDKYMIDETLCYKYAVSAGTTNSTAIKFGKDGTRRIMSVFIEYIDTEALSKINWHIFYHNFYKNEYLPKMKKRKPNDLFPWSLGSYNMNILQKLNSSTKAKSSLELYIDDIFDFSKPFDISGIKSIQTDKSGLVQTLAEVEHTINLYFSLFSINYKFNRSHLTHVLEEKLGFWTDTRFKTVALQKPKCIITNGLAIQGKYKKYLVPPKFDQSKI